MNRKFSTTTVAVSGIIIMVLTAALFFLLTDSDRRIAIDWWSLGFMLFAELAATVGIATLNSLNQGAYRLALLSGGVSALVFYAAASVALAFVFMNLLRPSYRLLVGLELALIAAAAIILLVLWSNAKRLGEVNSATMYSVTAMGGLVSRAEALWKNHGSASYARSLERLWEGLRYCDNTVMTQADQLIHQQLYDLESMLGASADAAAVEQQIGLLMATLRQRGAEAAQMKRGTI